MTLVLAAVVRNIRSVVEVNNKGSESMIQLEQLKVTLNSFEETLRDLRASL